MSADFFKEVETKGRHLAPGGRHLGERPGHPGGPGRLLDWKSGTSWTGAADILRRAA